MSFMVAFSIFLSVTFFGILLSYIISAKFTEAKEIRDEAEAARGQVEEGIQNCRGLMALWIERSTWPEVRELQTEDLVRQTGLLLEELEPTSLFVKLELLQREAECYSGNDIEATGQLRLLGMELLEFQKLLLMLTALGPVNELAEKLSAPFANDETQLTKEQKTARLAWLGYLPTSKND